MSTAPTPTSGPHPGSHVRSDRAGASRAGHAVGVLVNLAVLYLVNVRPGWDALSFLTADTPLVLGLVNLSLGVSVAAEASYVVVAGAGWRAFGDVVTTGVGLAAVVRVWQVFPFDVAGPWQLALRVLLVVAVVGSLIGIVAALARLTRAAARPVRPR